MAKEREEIDEKSQSFSWGEKEILSFVTFLQKNASPRETIAKFCEKIQTHIKNTDEFRELSVMRSSKFTKMLNNSEYMSDIQEENLKLYVAKYYLYELKQYKIYKENFKLNPTGNLNSNSIQIQDSLGKMFKEAQLLSGPLDKFFAADKASLAHFEARGIREYYYVYKMSYRFEKKVIKSIALFKKIAGKSMYFEWQKDDIGKNREFTGGVVFAKEDYVWIIAQETSKKQPRIFFVAPNEGHISKSENFSDFTEDSTIEILSGFCLEGYKKYKNFKNYPSGAFFSPIGFERISSASILEEAFGKSHLGLDEIDIFSDENIKQVIDFLSQKVGYLDSIDQIDVPEIKSFMALHRWTDYNNSS